MEIGVFFAGIRFPLQLGTGRARCTYRYGIGPVNFQLLILSGWGFIGRLRLRLAPDPEFQCKNNWRAWATEQNSTIAKVIFSPTHFQAGFKYLSTFSPAFCGFTSSKASGLTTTSNGLSQIP
jgi:hypothetical protein